MQNYVDIFSKGEVARYLVQLSKDGQVKECRYLGIEDDNYNTCYPTCTKDWAKRVPANNVFIDPSGFDGPSGYSWPQCPQDCFHFLGVDNFERNLGRPLFYGEEETTSTGAKKKETIDYEKITVSSLIHHVPIKYWVVLLGLLATSFIVGLKMGSIEWIQNIFQKMGW